MNHQSQKFGFLLRTANSVKVSRRFLSCRDIMSDPRFNLNPVESPEDAEVFKYIEANGETWSKDTPELAAVSKIKAYGNSTTKA